MVMGNGGSERRGNVVISEEAKQFAAKSSNEAKKLKMLIESANQLSARGFEVSVEGEGITGSGGELVLSREGFGKNRPVENKRLAGNTKRAIQTALEKGTKQVGDGGVVIIDGTGAQLNRETFESAWGTFKNAILPKRIEQGKPGQTGQILFIFGEIDEIMREF
jgi:hypothetical protein